MSEDRSKVTQDDVAEAIAAILGSLIHAVLLMWAINTLFGPVIPYTYSAWGATWLVRLSLCGVFRRK